MPIFLVLYDYAHSQLEKLNTVLNPVLDSKVRLKILMRGHSCIALLCEIFWDHTISLSPLGALECVVRMLVHFYFWNIEGALVPIDRCGFKDTFLFHVFIRSKHLTGLCYVTGHAFSWNSQQLLMWKSSSAMSLLKICAPELQRSQCPGWPLALRTNPPTNHCILSHSQVFHLALRFQCN